MKAKKNAESSGGNSTPRASSTPQMEEKKGPFNTALLARAASNAQSTSNTKDDSDGWSDDDDDPPVPPKPRSVEPQTSSFAKPTTAPLVSATNPTPSARAAEEPKPAVAPVAPQRSASPIKPAQPAVSQPPVSEPPTATKSLQQTPSPARQRMNARRSGVISRQDMDAMLNGPSKPESSSNTSSTSSANIRSSSTGNGNHDGARVAELQAEVDRLRDQVRRLEADKAGLERRLAEAQQEVRRPGPQSSGSVDSSSHELAQVPHCALCCQFQVEKALS
jgi:hypothetical protein